MTGKCSTSTDRVQRATKIPTENRINNGYDNKRENNFDNTTSAQLLVRRQPLAVVVVASRVKCPIWHRLTWNNEPHSVSNERRMVESSVEKTSGSKVLVEGG